MTVEYQTGESAIQPELFLELARKVRADEYDVDQTRAALARTINIGAFVDGALVGSVRVLSDGCFFSTVADVMVDPAYQHMGIGKELMRRAIGASPGKRLYLAAQPGTEPFFERVGFRRGPVGYVARPVTD